ncbi:MAG: hypothetical protein P1U32_00665 [Legionellaceae bacterium]|nr:hypothetical protein [Legionellaceae bacterium]
MSIDNTEQSLRQQFNAWGNKRPKEDSVYAETGSKLACGIQTYMQAHRENLSEKSKQDLKSMLFLIEQLTNATTRPTHISQGIKMENMLAAIVTQADKLIAKLESKKSAHLTTNKARDIYEEAIEKVKSIRQNALLYQAAHNKAKESGECWIPSINNSDRKQFEALAKDIEHLQTFVESNAKTFEHGWFGSFLAGLNKLLENAGFSAQKSASMREQIRDLKKDVDELDPSNTANSFDI